MRYHFSSRMTATLNLCLIYFKITWALAILLERMDKKFEINRTKIKGGCQSGRKVVTHNSKSNLPLVMHKYYYCRDNWIFTLTRSGDLNKRDQEPEDDTYARFPIRTNQFHLLLSANNKRKIIRANVPWEIKSWLIHKMSSGLMPDKREGEFVN